MRTERIARRIAGRRTGANLGHIADGLAEHVGEALTGPEFRRRFAAEVGKLAGSWRAFVVLGQARARVEARPDGGADCVAQIPADLDVEGLVGQALHGAGFPRDMAQQAVRDPVVKHVAELWLRGAVGADKSLLHPDRWPIIPQLREVKLVLDPAFIWKVYSAEMYSEAESGGRGRLQVDCLLGPSRDWHPGRAAGAYPATPL